MPNNIIKCPSCSKCFFDIGQINCPHCNKSLDLTKLSDETMQNNDIFNQIFKNFKQ
jgi:hypothetical protein